MAVVSDIYQNAESREFVRGAGVRGSEPAEQYSEILSSTLVELPLEFWHC